MLTRDSTAEQSFPFKLTLQQENGELLENYFLVARNGVSTQWEDALGNILSGRKRNFHQHTTNVFADEWHKLG